MRRRTMGTCWFAWLSVLAACADNELEFAAGAGAGLSDAAPELSWVSTEHVGQFTGAAPNLYARTLGLIGTDLGVSFQRGNKLYFLFGDGWTPAWFLNGNQDLDTIAWTDAARPDGVPRLNWFTRPNSREFLAFGLAGS